jgi:hypothetical protein
MRAVFLVLALAVLPVQALTIPEGQRAVAKQLKDPESARFEGVFTSTSADFGTVVCGYVNAKNAFGGYTGRKAFVTSGTTVILEGRDHIREAWRAACR